MFSVAVRSMLAHRLRLVLTTLSIALGVAFLAGTFVLTDTTHKAFDQLFGKISMGTSAVVRMESAFSTSVGSEHAPIAADTLNDVRSVAGVRAAAGDTSGYALITDTHGDAVLTNGGAPTLGMTYFRDRGLRGDVEVASGRAPRGPNEVVIDEESAGEHDIPVGASVNILLHGPTQKFTVVGIATFGGQKSLGGATTAYFDEATAQRVLGEPRTYDQIVVAAADGVTETELVRRLGAVVPQGGEAVTGAAVTQEFSDDADEALSFVTVVFSVFAGIALFVGSFIIWNTFTMVVVQRTREIALLRAVGATRGQVMRSLVLEAVLLGVAASAIGVLLGVAVAKGLSALMNVLGFALPTTGTEIQPRTVVIPILVGTLVTLAAALIPAMKATRVLPVEALRDAEPAAARPSMRRAAIGTVLTGAGVGTLFAGLLGGGLALVGLGVLAVVLGVTVLGPLAVRPLATAIGWPLRRLGASGELAQQNAMRSPKRTAATAAALMIGLTLVVGVAVFASSLKASISGLLTDSTHADLFIARASNGTAGFSPQVSREVARVPGVALVSPTGFGEARFAGDTATYNSVDPATVERALDLDVSAGSAADLGTNGVVISKDSAKSHHWQVGSTVPTEFAATGKRNMTVVGIYDHTGGFLDGDYVLSRATQAQVDGTRLDTAALVLLAPGANRDAVQNNIDAALANHPDAKVLTTSEYAKDTNSLIDQLLIFVTVMLLLAVAIALLGIVNTLALSVFERTRELGLLRAIGMTRGQVRAMVRWESVIIAVIGAITGAVLGTGIGIALVSALRDEGIKEISVPAWQIALYLAAAAVAGVLAAIGPSRSASRVDVLKAVVAD
jgi:putative ABC transport system permease protein